MVPIKKESNENVDPTHLYIKQALEINRSKYERLGFGSS